MKYSVLGFNQAAVTKLVGKHNGKIVKLDVTDLLILQNVADFMNRPNIIKYTIEDKTYFSIQYSVIIEDLPIIDIKQQALRDRMDKMVALGTLEKRVVKNAAGTWVAFRLGEKYESLKYTHTSSETTPTGSELPVREYQTTSHNTKVTKTNTSNKNKEKKDNNSYYLKKKERSRDDLSYVGDDMKDIWAEWLGYLDALGKPYRIMQTAKQNYHILVDLAQHDVNVAERIVRRSIAKGYWSLFPLREVDTDTLIPAHDDAVVINGQVYR